MKAALWALFSRGTYAAATNLSRAVFTVFADWEVVGAEHLPRDGGVVVVANHLHLVDPPLVSASCRRRLHPMGKFELFQTPLVGWALWAYGAFPVRRFSADMGALRAARNLLRGGEVVLMFPEGTRSRDRVLHPGLPGAAMVAILAGVPVVPVAITGTEAIRLPGAILDGLRGRRLHIRVEFGAPLRLDTASADTRQAEAATDQMMRALAALLPEQYRGAYGPGTEGQVVFARQEQVDPRARPSKSPPD